MSLPENAAGRREELSLSVVIPARNEEDSIAETVGEIRTDQSPAGDAADSHSTAPSWWAVAVSAPSSPEQTVSTSGASLATTIQRLSSGLRINSAKDDAAGLAIS